MPKVYQKKNLRTAWSKDVLEGAVKEIREKKRSVNAVSKEYNIPRRTLRDYLQRGTCSTKLGRNTILSEQLERDLCDRIIRLANVGYPVTSKTIRSCVFTFCEINNIKNNFNSDMRLAGRDWLKSFLNRHPNIAKRKSQSMNPGRAAKLNPVVVGDYFKKLEETMESLGVMQMPECIYNVDEKGCRLSLHKNQHVFTQKGAKNVHIVSQEHGESVSIVSCGNALGNIIPPMILFKGVRMKSEWMDGLPPGSIAAMTPRGSMTCEIFVHWLDHLAKYKSQGKCLLIFDGATCHLDYKIVDAAEKHGITLLCLPSQTTHELQPMDKAVFGPFETYWDQEVLQFIRQNPGKSITKLRFSNIFTTVWDRAATPVNIKAGFRGTGIYPFKPDIISDTAYAPSAVTQIFTQPDDQNVTKKTVTTSAMKNIRVTPAHNATLALIDANDIPGPSQVSTAINTLSPTSTIDSNNIPGPSTSSFKSILSTPKRVTLSGKRRTKSMNSLAVVLKKELFPNRTEEESKSPKGLTKKKKERKTKKKSTESWYCPVCCKDEVLDMRQCLMCNVYFHEICVGLTIKDKDKFICMNCS